MRVLVIEDESDLRRLLTEILEEEGYAVDAAADGEDGLSKAQMWSYDVIVLDIMLPKIDGWDVLETLRETHQTPVLILSARDALSDRVLGLDIGADDYLVKPFEFRELLARLRALSKRTIDTSLQANLLKVADLELDLNEKIARRGGKRIELTAKEFALLEYLMRNRSRVVSRIDIAEKVWDIHFDTGTNVIDVYVNFLRKKVDKDFPVKLIHTVIGMGYMLKEE